MKKYLIFINKSLSPEIIIKENTKPDCSVNRAFVFSEVSGWCGNV